MPARHTSKMIAFLSGIAALLLATGAAHTETNARSGASHEWEATRMVRFALYFALSLGVLGHVGPAGAAQMPEQFRGEWPCWRWNCAIPTKPNLTRRLALLAEARRDDPSVSQHLMAAMPSSRLTWAAIQG